MNTNQAHVQKYFHTRGLDLLHLTLGTYLKYLRMCSLVALCVVNGVREAP